MPKYSLTELLARLQTLIWSVTPTLLPVIRAVTANPAQDEVHNNPQQGFNIQSVNVNISVVLVCKSVKWKMWSYDSDITIIPQEIKIKVLKGLVGTINAVNPSRRNRKTSIVQDRILNVWYADCRPADIWQVQCFTTRETDVGGWAGEHERALWLSMLR